jgi:oligopeptide/dipeptide ABC transporter ATP-binding protein
MKIQGVSALEYLLQVERLKTTFYTEDGAIPAVDGISFRLRPGETVGIVGESGCGKSVAVLSLMRLIPHPPGAVSADSILFDGQELSALSENEMRRICGNDMAMIFQEPMSSLNPVFTIGNQLSEAIRLHQRLKEKEARAKSVEMLKTVGIPRAEKVYDEYPHSLSGGMRQRAMIAMALSCRPKLLIADEPTTALDVTIQAQILKLMTDLKHSFNTAIIFITHDLGVIAEMAQHVIVMYAGKIVEDTDVFTLFHKPRHPYTIGLINSKPKIEEEVEKLRSIPGLVPNPLNMPAGCSYHPRCAEADDLCRVEAPAEIEIKPGHRVRCWLYTGRKGVNSP